MGLRTRCCCTRPPAAPQGNGWGLNVLVLRPVNSGAVSALSITTTHGSYFKTPTLHFAFVTDTEESASANCQQFFVCCKAVLFHRLLGVLSVVSRDDKRCSKLADERGRSDDFLSDKIGKRGEFCHWVNAVEPAVGKQSISPQWGMEQLSFCRQRYCLTLLNPPAVRQCYYLFSILPNMRIIAKSAVCFQIVVWLQVMVLLKTRVCTISVFII